MLLNIVNKRLNLELCSWQAQTKPRAAVYTPHGHGHGFGHCHPYCHPHPRSHGALLMANTLISQLAKGVLYLRDGGTFLRNHGGTASSNIMMGFYCYFPLSVSTEVYFAQKY